MIGKGFYAFVSHIELVRRSAFWSSLALSVGSFFQAAIVVGIAWPSTTRAGFMLGVCKKYSEALASIRRSVRPFTVIFCKKTTCSSSTTQSQLLQ